MHEELWGAVDFKLRSAQFFLQEMGNDLAPVSFRSQSTPAIQSSAGAIVGSLWQERFYPHLDAFLAITRSVPDIIQSCFGADPRVNSKKRTPIKVWFTQLDSKEQNRRRNFQSQFAKDYEDFNKLPLSRARLATLHRGGTPPVEVQIPRRWRQRGLQDTYIGGPLKRLPSSESAHIIAGEDPALQMAATHTPLPVEPIPDSFVLTIASSRGTVKRPLFRECKQYVVEARNLRNKACLICQRVHGSEQLTAPPSI